MGKTALIEQVVQSAPDVARGARAVGVESEMELPFAALHQLCAPMLDRLDVLAAPRARRVRTVFGLSHGDAPNRFLVGLGVLSLLAELGAEQPLVCVVDDAQWLDQASAQTMAFVGTSVAGRSGGVAVRGPRRSSRVRRLARADAHRHRRSQRRRASRFGPPVRVGHRGAKPHPRRGGREPVGVARARRAGCRRPSWPAGSRSRRRCRSPTGSRRRSAGGSRHCLAEARALMFVAAAEPVGDPVVVLQAARALDIPPDAAEAAAADGLLEVGTRVTFRHPLVRSVAYHAATPGPAQPRAPGARGRDGPGGRSGSAGLASCPSDERARRRRCRRARALRRPSAGPWWFRRRRRRSSSDPRR